MQEKTNIQTGSKLNKKGTEKKEDKQAFEEKLMPIQEQQIALEESKAKAENEAENVRNRATLMREVRKLQDDGFTDQEISSVFLRRKEC